MAHLHVIHGGDEVKLTIRSQKIVEGFLRGPQLEEAQAWIRSNRNRLLKMWKRRMEPDGIKVIAEKAGV